MQPLSLDELNTLNCISAFERAVELGYVGSAVEYKAKLDQARAEAMRDHLSRLRRAAQGH